MKQLIKLAIFFLGAVVITGFMYAMFWYAGLVQASGGH